MQHVLNNIFLILFFFGLGANQLVKADLASDAKTIFNGAESQYGQYFTPELSTQTLPNSEWPYYRGPYNNNIYAGINSDGSVYVLGGAFGNTPARIGTLAEVLALLINSTDTTISGKLFIGSDRDGPWIMDFSTGRYTPIPGVLWKDNSKYHHNADFSALASRDGQEFIETIDNCKYLGGFDYQSCIILHDSLGNILSSYDLPYEETHGPARLSRNKQYFAVPVQDPSSSLNPKELTLFKRDGSRINGSNESVSTRNFDWLPDNRLIYASEQTIYITQPNSAQGSELVSFPEADGIPTQLAVSPDGSKLAFTLSTHQNFVAVHGTTWILNLDTSDLRQLTNTPGENDPSTTTDDPIINFPTWSPDGKWIAVVEGVVSAATSPTDSVQGDLYIVPSDGKNVMLTLNEATSAIPIQSYFNGTFDWIDPGEEELSSRFNVYRGGLVWLP